MSKRTRNSPGQNACDLPSTSSYQYPDPIESEEAPEPDNWGDQDNCEEVQKRMRKYIEKLEKENDTYKEENEELTEGMKKMKETAKKLQDEKDIERIEKEKEQEEKLALKRQMEEMKHLMEELQGQLDEERKRKAPRREEVDMDFNIDFDNAMGHYNDVEEEEDNRKEALNVDNHEELMNAGEDEDGGNQREGGSINAVQNQTASPIPVDPWNRAADELENLKKQQLFKKNPISALIWTHCFSDRRGRVKTVRPIPPPKSLYDASSSNFNCHPKKKREFDLETWKEVYDVLLNEQKRQIQLGIIRLSDGNP